MVKLLDHFSLDMLRYPCSAKIKLLNTQEAKDMIRKLMKKSPIRLGLENKDLAEIFFKELDIPQTNVYANMYSLKKGDKAIVGLYINRKISWAYIEVYESSKKL